MDPVVDVNQAKNVVGNDISVIEEEGTAMPNQRSDGEKEVTEKATSYLDTLPTTVLDAVAGKWQMAAVVHFFWIFRDHLPVDEVVLEDERLDIRARTLERAVAEPELDPALPLVMRDAVAVLLLALRRVSVKRCRTHWFEALRALASARPDSFPDTNGAVVIREWGDAMGFLVEAPWTVRLGTLAALCELALDEADCVRMALAGDESAEVPPAESRLVPFARDSQKKWYFLVGKERIYSGFKRRGDGKLTVECSDGASMRAFVLRMKNGGEKEKQIAETVNIQFQPQVDLDEGDYGQRPGNWQRSNGPTEPQRIANSNDNADALAGKEAEAMAQGLRLEETSPVSVATEAPKS